MKGKRCTLLLVLLSLQLAFAFPAEPQVQNSFDSVSFTIYQDGYVLVKYTVEVDVNSPTANVSLFSQTISSVLLTDEYSLPLEYSRVGNYLLVNTLGINSVKVSYSTQDLTRKDGRFWTFSASSPANTTVVMPTEATVVGFNEVPNLIDNQGDQMMLIMPAGEVQVTYIVGVVGTEEYAQAILNEAQQAIDEIRELNINVSQAEALLQLAWSKFQSGSFSEAETLGTQAKTLATQVNLTAHQAQIAIAQAEVEIASAEAEGRTSGLGEARTLLALAENQFENGEYAEALRSALELQNQAKASELSSAEDGLNSGFALRAGIFVSIIIAALVAGLFLFRFRQKRLLASKAEKKRELTAEKVFRRTDLRQEEKEAIRILLENKGEVLEAELYSELNLPRTTTWRLVRRLEKMGLVEISKSRRDNVVRLKK